MAVNNIIKRIQKIMRSDAGINGDAQRIEQMTWMFFLKVYDTQEETWEYKAYKEKKEYSSIIPEPLRWRNWAADEKDGKALTGDALLSFINNILFPVIKGQDAEYNGETIKGIIVTAKTPRSKSIVQETFADLNQYMKDGTLLRQVINIVNEIEFDDAEDRHTFGDIYEGILKGLQSAGNAGEFYTPRALTDFIVKMLNPQLGETFGDFTSGTGGFLTSAINHMASQVKSAADGEKLQQAIIGQEWKPLPYLLSITNLLLHDIEAPNIRHCDSLGTNVSDFKDSDKVDVIGMNPPYGGSTGTNAQNNFPSAFRTSETANLFIALIMYRLKAGGRAGVIIPDGLLFGDESAELAIKESLLRKFNLHTIIRLPGSIFAPYTSINTNILFFDNETANDADEGFRTKETWFYRLDMPEGYKHFSKTKPMKLEHTTPIQDWWVDRKEIVSEEFGDKARKFSAQELVDLNFDFDQCKFPKDEEEVLSPDELFKDYHERRDKLNAEIEKRLASIHNSILTIDTTTEHHEKGNPWQELSVLNATLPDRLYKSILLYAIQGKLLPQRENEHADEFLQIVRNNKKELVKNKILKKSSLNVRPISDEEIPYEIPQNWRWVRFEDIALGITGKTPERGNSNYWLTPIYPWVSISDMNDWSHVKATKESISEKASSLMREISPKGSLLMSFKLTVGRTSILDIDAYHNEAIITVKPFADKNNYLRNYLFTFLPLITQSGKSKDAIKGKTLNAKSISALLVPMPPIEEMHRIVEKVSELFSMIDVEKFKL